MLWVTSFLVMGCILRLVASRSHLAYLPPTPFNSGRGHPSGTQGGSGGFGGLLSTDLGNQYNGPAATVMVLPDGTLADTPEVAVAKKMHLAALEKAKALWTAQKSRSGQHELSGHAAKGSGQSFAGHDSNAQDGQYSGASARPWPSATEDKRYDGPLAVVKVLPDGTIADTPEVAAAKVAHLTALEKAKARWPGKNGAGGQSRGGSQNFGGYDSNAQNRPSSGTSYGPSSSGSIADSSSAAKKLYQGPPAMVILLPDGTLADTPEVAAAKIAHLAALEKAKAHRAGKKGDAGQSRRGSQNFGDYDFNIQNRPSSGTSYGLSSSGSIAGSSSAAKKLYQGPPAMVILLPDGTLADTPEVAAAKISHLAALEKAKGLRNGKNGDGGESRRRSQNFGGYDSNAQNRPSSGTSYGSSSSGSVAGSSSASNKPYQGSPATVMVLSDGTLADTPEVAAAKMAHLAAIEMAKALWAGKNGDGGQSRRGSQNFGGYDSNARDRPSSETSHGLSSLGSTAGSSSASTTPYQGPLAKPMVLPSGFLADTPNIEAARMAHLTLFRAATGGKPVDWKLS